MQARITLVLAATAVAFGLAATAASASTPCTDQPRSAWMKAEEVRTRLEQQGYRIRRVKVDNNCYEVYATDRDGKQVEMYVDPVTAKTVSTKVESKERR